MKTIFALGLILLNCSCDDSKTATIKSNIPLAKVRAGDCVQPMENESTFIVRSIRGEEYIGNPTGDLIKAELIGQNNEITEGIMQLNRNITFVKVKCPPSLQQ